MPTPEPAFCFPIRRLENNRTILLPFDFSSYAELFVQGTKETPELFSYVSQGPFLTAADFEAFYKSRILSTNTILANPMRPIREGYLLG